MRLLLRAGAGSVLLGIADDGRGMEQGRAAAHGSLGLLGMRERARELGGTVDIDGRPRPALTADWIGLIFLSEPKKDPA